MKVVIPAAGIGKRLRPHTYSLPKALLFVAGKPLLSHILDDVASLDISSVVLIVGYKGDLIETYVRERYPGLRVDFVFQEQRLGIGHAIYLARDWADKGEPILGILGDTIIKADLEKFIDSPANVLGVKEVKDPRRFGVCEVQDGRIVRLIEKPKSPTSNLAVVGLYYLRDSALLFECLQDEIEKGIKTHGEYQVTDALQMMIERGAEFRHFFIDGWFDCGKPEALLEANRGLLEASSEVPPIEGSIIVPPVSIASRAQIVTCIIGPFVSIGSNSIVKHSIVRNSVLDEEVTVVESLLEGSLVGARAVVRGSFRSLSVGDSSEVVFK